MAIKRRAVTETGSSTNSTVTSQPWRGAVAWLPKIAHVFNNHKDKCEIEKLSNEKNKNNQEMWGHPPYLVFAHLLCACYCFTPKRSPMTSTQSLQYGNIEQRIFVLVLFYFCRCATVTIQQQKAVLAGFLHHLQVLYAQPWTEKVK